MNFPRLELTRIGIDAVLEAVYDSKTLTFTCAKLGSGSTTESAETITAMITPEKTIGLSSIVVEDGVAALTFTLQNSDIETGFYMRELGIFANLDEGEDFLYAYANAGAEAAYIKPYDQDSLVELPFVVNVAVGNAEYVTAVISGAVGYATTQDLLDHINDHENPHQVTKSQVGLGNVPNLTPSNMTINFTKTTSLTVPTSGSKLSIIAGILAKGIESLATHLRDKSNPHMVTCEQIEAAPDDHTHTMSDLSGTLPISKGGTGVSSENALKNLIIQLINASSIVNTFPLTIGSATKVVGNGPASFTLSEIGIDAESAFHDCQSEFVWGTGKIINKTTGALENASSSYDDARYGRKSVTGGEEFWVKTWMPYNMSYFGIYDGDDRPISWHANVMTSYTTNAMYMQEKILVPPGASYVIAMDYSEFTGHPSSEYSIMVR